MTKNSDQLELHNNFRQDQLETIDLIWEKLLEAENVIVIGHLNPDGDTIGSVFSFYKVLTEMGKQVFPCLGDSAIVPPQYEFLPRLDKYSSPKRFPDEALVVMVDCTNIERLGNLADKIEDQPFLINIDHHHDNKNFGNLNLVGDQFSSTSEVLYRLYRLKGVDIDKEVALMLYTGIVTDTGRFQYRNTTVDTLAIASDLVKIGVEPNYVFEKVYEKLSYGAIKLMGKAIENACFLEEIGLIYTTVAQEELRATGALLAETENFIDLIRLVDGANIAAVFKEMQDGTLRVSLRSKFTYDVSKIAAIHGGGGHRNASGYSTKGPLEAAIAELVNNVESLVFKNKVIVADPITGCKEI